MEGNHYGLGLTYENFWFPRASSPSLSSEDSDVPPAPIRPKVKPGDQKSLGVQRLLKDSQLAALLQTQTVKIQELQLAYRMKLDEMKSLKRLSEQLSHFHQRLTEAIGKYRGTHARSESMEDCTEEVHWEDSIFHDSPSDQR